MLINLHLKRKLNPDIGLLIMTKKSPIILFAFWMITLIYGGLTPSLAKEITLPKIESGQVVLSWQELKLLLEELETLKQEKKQAQEKAKKTPKPPPTEYTITKANYNGTIEGESIKFEASFSVNVLKDGWVNIPFFPNTVGIETVEIEYEDLPINTLENEPEQSSESEIQPIVITDEIPVIRSSAQFIRGEDGYSLIAKGLGKFRIQTTFYISLDVENLIYSLNFTPPRSVINKIALRIPQNGVRLTQAKPTGEVIQGEKETTFKTVLRTRDTLNLSWKIEKDAGITRKKQVITYTLASIDKSTVDVSVTALVKHVTSLDEIAFHVPLDTEILNVTGSEIDQWHVEQTETARIIKVSGQPDRHSGAEITFSYRLPLPTTLPATIKIPVMEIHGADNMTGYLGIEPLGNIEVTTESTDKGSIIPARNLPKQIWNSAANPILHGYEFHSNEFSPSLTIKSYLEIQTVVANVDLVDSVTYRTLAGKSVTRLRYFIRNNDRQFLTLKLPEKSHIWQAFLEGKPVKPARKETGEILIPMKKSPSTGEFRSFLIEVGYITDVSTLSLKGDIINQLPSIDVPISYLRWTIHLPEYYGYSRFEGPLKHVNQFSTPQKTQKLKPLINIPVKGQRFLFEKFLIVDEIPYVKAKYGQYLGDDIFLSASSDGRNQPSAGMVQELQQPSLRKDSRSRKNVIQQQIIPNQY